MRVLACLFVWSAVAQAGAAQTGAPRTGTVLRVESEPQGAFVTIDSVRAGRTPVDAAVAPGTHRVRVSYSGYTPADLTVAVPAGDTTVVAPALVRLTGVLTVSGLPPGATATTQGAPLDGPTAVPSGPVQVRVAVPGMRAVTQTVVVAAGGEASVQYLPRIFDAATLATAVGAPSVAQFRGGRPLVGVAVLAGIAGGIGMAALAHGSERDAAGRVAQAVSQYGQAGSEAEAVAAFAVAEVAFDEQGAARRRRNVALGAAAAVYGASIADALVRHAFRPALRPATRAPGISAHGAGLRLAFPL